MDQSMIAERKRAGQSRPNRLSVAILLGLCCLVSVGSARGGGTKPMLEIAISGFRNDVGNAGVSIFASAKGFPDNPALALKRQMVAIKGRHASVLVPDLPPGQYAVSVLHDENGNQKMDKNFLGIPKEGWGVSNNVRPSMSAPKFADAAFQLPADGLKLHIQIGY
jgi:uncharacterized protein (DUF2141 family)